MYKSSVPVWIKDRLVVQLAATAASVIYISSMVSRKGARVCRLTMATTMMIPNPHMIRLMLRHHLAFSYRPSSIGPSCFSRSPAICVRRRASLPLALSNSGLGGNGRNAAINHAFSGVSRIFFWCHGMLGVVFTWRKDETDREEQH